MELQPLVATGGVWSPVRANAWYVLTLLVSLLLMTMTMTKPEAPLSGLTITDTLSSSNHYSNVEMGPLVALVLGRVVPLDYQVLPVWLHYNNSSSSNNNNTVHTLGKISCPTTILWFWSN
jgi:hypothetical protein